MTSCTRSIVQCKTCPWRVDADPYAIPNYQRELHAKLDRTIQSGVESLFRVLSTGTRNVMACHYSKAEAEFPCAGWLHNQLGVGNNIAIRLAVMSGKLPPPEVDGPQHERFEDTLPPEPQPSPSKSRKRVRRRKSA